MRWESWCSVCLCGRTGSEGKAEGKWMKERPRPWGRSNPIKCQLTPLNNCHISICASLLCVTSLASYRSCCPTISPHQGVHPVFWRYLVGSNFLLIMWSVYQSDSFRTNNHLEGWHDCLNGNTHPNIYEFVEVVQKEQTATEALHSWKLESALFKEPWKPLAGTERYKNLKNILMPKNYFRQGMSAHNNVYIVGVLYLYSKHYIELFFKSRGNTTPRAVILSAVRRRGWYRHWQDVPPGVQGEEQP